VTQIAVSGLENAELKLRIFFVGRPDVFQIVSASPESSCAFGKCFTRPLPQAVLTQGENRLELVTHLSGNV
jgi:hypothetical protein